MTIVKSVPVKKIVHGNLYTLSETSVVSESQYQTNGESFILVKDVQNCKIKVASNTTEHVTIKALTTVMIVPDINSIDEEWDQINIDRGACVEFRYVSNHWYIISSDGLKLK
jgi:hypothetical protein